MPFVLLKTRETAGGSPPEEVRNRAQEDRRTLSERPESVTGSAVTRLGQLGRGSREREANTGWRGLREGRITAG